MGRIGTLEGQRGVLVVLNVQFACVFTKEKEVVIRYIRDVDDDIAEHFEVLKFWVNERGGPISLLINVGDGPSLLNIKVVMEMERNSPEITFLNWG